MYSLVATRPENRCRNSILLRLPDAWGFEIAWKISTGSSSSEFWRALIAGVAGIAGIGMCLKRLMLSSVRRSG